jgi:hypothetical protein
MAPTADFPFAAGSLGAVQIHPPVSFGNPLSLTIQILADQMLSSTQPHIGFNVSSFNSELSLAPIYPAGGNAYQMLVYWGDTFGLAPAMSVEVKAHTGRIPSDSSEQLAQQMAALQAFRNEATPMGDARIFTQIWEGLLEQADDFRSQDSDGIHAKLAAPALQSQSGAALWTTIQRWERAWSEDQYNPLYDQTLHQPLDPGRRAELIVELTEEINRFLEMQKGCRHRNDLYIQALLQILINPESAFQQAIADNYRSRFGPPEQKKRCTFQLQIVNSQIEAGGPSTSGVVQTTRVHTNPFPLEVVVRGSKISLRGVGPVIYEQYKIYDDSCPPELDVLPFPDSSIWITDLAPIFDAEGRVSNFALKGVLPDPILVNQDAAGTFFSETDHNGTCEAIKWESRDGVNPDAWGMHFPNKHNSFKWTDTWTVEGDESYIATGQASTGGGGGELEENTMMVLTVNYEE